MWTKISLALLLSVGLVYGSSAAAVQERTSVQVGNYLEVPCYDLEAVYYQENQELDRSSMNAVKELLFKVLSNLFEKDELISMGEYRSILHEVKKWKDGYVQIGGQEPGFSKKPKEFWQMLAELEQSIRTSTSNEEITSEEALSRFRDLHYGISKLMSRNPWGFYLRWNELKIGQQPSVEYLAPAIQKLRKSGGQALLVLVNDVFQLVFK